jgi:hypothetical protein
MLGCCVAVALLLSSSVAAQLQSEDLKSVDGTWEGTLHTYFRDLTTGDPMQPQDRASEFRIVIRKVPTETQTKTAQGAWQSDGQGLLPEFKYETAAGTLVGHFLKSGRDADGQWVEHQDVYLTRKDSQTLLLYWLRAVNNLDRPLTVAQSKWALFRVAELHKLP